VGVKVKICGITNLDDALLCAELGADAVGFVFYKGSKRYIEPYLAKDIIERLPPFLIKVGVFVEEPVEEILRIKVDAMLDRIQLYDRDGDLRHGICPNITLMAYRIRDSHDIERAKGSIAFPLLDAYHDDLYGGTGRRFDWQLLMGFGRPFILAGGINSENIEDALRLRPYAIDIASGCERSPGIKDPEKMAKIFEAIKRVHRYERGIM
jgi:phosphoribosylanthranilate isomerase